MEPRTSSVKTQSYCSGCQSPTMLFPTRENGMCLSESAERVLAECVPVRITPLGRFDRIRASGSRTAPIGAFRSDRKHMKCMSQSCWAQYPSAPRRILDWNSLTVSRFPNTNVMVRFLLLPSRLMPALRAAAATADRTEGATRTFPFATCTTVDTLTFARRATSAYLRGSAESEATSE